jgi:hypothetical protein
VKVTLPNPEDQFILRETIVAGEECILVFPAHIGAKWNKHNLIFRSSLWRKSDLMPMSLGFRKFFNWGEQPDLCPIPEDISNVTAIEKLDGSLLMVSAWNGEIIARTRGTVDASILENGHEIELFKDKYPKAFDPDFLPKDVTYLFEWTSPTNTIVINHNEPELALIGCVRHNDYSLVSQGDLNVISEIFGVKRPATHKFDSLSDMLERVSAWKNKEGLCVYFERGQEIRKTKSEWYLSLHRLKSELGSFERVIDFFIASGCPTYQDALDTIEKTIDFEVAQRVRGDVSRCADGWKECKKILAGMAEFVERVKQLPSRKEQAQQITDSYGSTNRAGMLFTLLDGRELELKDYKRLLFQVLKHKK